MDKSESQINIEKELRIIKSTVLVAMFFSALGLFIIAHVADNIGE